MADSINGISSATCSRVSDEEFHLDTKNFNTLITDFKNLATNMSELKSTLDVIMDNLVEDWIGNGSNAFQTKYKILTRQMLDIKDELFEISDKIASDYSAYMQADTDLAKTQVGVDSRY